ncbi:MAG: MerR family transcriptional regulator [Gammaproteobacteria bacterium]|jgi:DNA-binding transcriptional MerR regulator|nr:MerR family transcriptional regulator [Gammaproteobacteria bacterium]MBT3725007.1 MerR family transcriptional regulator [Gammaproteobacteria bacterium]MBT4075070.1 MerR family transcriptional regulator [Gammaproteobacteria bacterium]MBT4193870.1 MerR family transcriptional regulator [Gammaproteobacteria bacterium]MBT4449718.1 MerR family transcriptional regulator [Gammaproteobacteria bacterium]
MFTIGQVAKKYSLSRSTLIYYDSKGILKPSGRSVSNYRLYSENDLKLVERIILFRSAGLSIESIQPILASKHGQVEIALENRLSKINIEIQELRTQQNLILQLIGNDSLSSNARVIDKTTWVTVLDKAGLDDNGKQKWHQEFEAIAPEAHQDFLESIGIGSEEINSIRKWSSKN